MACIGTSFKNRSDHRRWRLLSPRNAVDVDVVSIARSRMSMEHVDGPDVRSRKLVPRVTSSASVYVSVERSVAARTTQPVVDAYPLWCPSPSRCVRTGLGSARCVSPTPQWCGWRCPFATVSPRLCCPGIDVHSCVDGVPARRVSAILHACRARYLLAARWCRVCAKSPYV